MLQLFFFYFTFAPAKERKDIELNYRHRKYEAKVALFDGGEMVDVLLNPISLWIAWSSLFSISGLTGDCGYCH